MSISEAVFKTRFKKRIEKKFPSCYLIDMNGSELQGIMDLLILNNSKWAMLEFKRSEHARHQPNQDYYVLLFDKMGFADFVFPENADKILNDLINYFNN